MKNTLTPLADRFWAKTEPEPNSGCLLWTGAAVTSDGKRWYGVLGIGRRGAGIMLAHRLAFALAGGIPERGMDVMHKCDNTRCVNAAHLSLGTRQDNMRDCSAKGRAVAVGKSKTHCPRGHEYTEPNTYRDRRGCRRCKTCRRDGIREANRARRMAEKRQAR